MENHAGGKAVFEALVKVLQGELSTAFVIGAGLDDGAVAVGWVTKLFSEVELLVGVA